MLSVIKLLPEKLVTLSDTEKKKDSWENKDMLEPNLTGKTPVLSPTDFSDYTEVTPKLKKKLNGLLPKLLLKKMIVWHLM